MVFRSLFKSCTLVLGICLVVFPSSARSEATNVLSLLEGCLPVTIPATYDGWEAYNLLDDSLASGWANATGKTLNNVFVFEMAAGATLDSFEFDTAAADAEGAAAKDILVEISAQSASGGFAKVLQVTLANTTDGQKFKVEKALSGQWVRLTIKNNYGNTEYTEMFGFRGYGNRPDPGKSPEMSGTYSTNYADFHVRQQGTALAGCYEYNDGLLDGAIEGRVMKITWQEGPESKGPAIMVFSKEGNSFKGFWWRDKAEGNPAGTWDGTKKSTTVGSCPHWSGSLKGELQKKLKANGRASIYGIRFALDSAVIQAPSYPILTEIVDVLKADTSLRLTIEGHTDALGAAGHNQTLSEQRAASVKAYLVDKGVAGDRLATMGFGPSKPVAGNDNELGRAQNRRVELVRQ
ncbi:MAG: OmpA family protein [Desulforhopalus sp.]|nr:OmpA family protein [Desulforhopalus sp.]